MLLLHLQSFHTLGHCLNYVAQRMGQSILDCLIGVLVYESACSVSHHANSGKKKKKKVSCIIRPHNYCPKCLQSLENPNRNTILVDSYSALNSCPHFTASCVSIWRLVLSKLVPDHGPTFAHTRSVDPRKILQPMPLHHYLPSQSP